MGADVPEEPLIHLGFCSPRRQQKGPVCIAVHSLVRGVLWLCCGVTQQPPRAPGWYLSDYLGFRERMFYPAAVLVHIFPCSPFTAAQLMADSYSVISDSHLSVDLTELEIMHEQAARLLWVRSWSAEFLEGLFRLVRSYSNLKDGSKGCQCPYRAFTVPLQKHGLTAIALVMPRSAACFLVGVSCPSDSRWSELNLKWKFSFTFKTKPKQSIFFM